MSKPVEGRIKEIEILKNKKNKAGRDDTNNQYLLLSSLVRFFLNVDTSNIIDNDRHSKYQNIDRDERHVETTARRKQQRPPVLMRKEEVQRRYDGEEDEEVKRVKEHV
jgi:hypothetical protein